MKITDEMILKYNNMVHALAYKYKNKLIENDDMVQVGYIAVMEAYKKYKDDKGMSFNSFVYKMIEWGMLDAINRLKDIEIIKKSCSIYTPVADDVTLIDLFEDATDDFKRILDQDTIEEYYINMDKTIINRKHFNILKDLVFNAMSELEVAKKHNVSTRYVANVKTSSKYKLLRNKFYQEAYDKYYEPIHIDHTGPVDVVYGCIEANRKHRALV